MAKHPTSAAAPTAARRDASLDQVWKKMQPLLLSKRDELFAAMAAHDLTPPHSQALAMLSGGPLRMRDIADQMVCDASYVTAIVDNLEHLGLAERRPSATDRRVKEIALTPSGAETARQFHDLMTSPPAALLQLSRADRSALATILGKLELDESHPLWPMAARRPPTR